MTATPNEHICFLTDDNGMVLTLTNMTLGAEPEVRYPATLHIGFIQPTEADVDQMNDRLRADGYEIPTPSRQRGAWTFYFQAPGGFTIEVLAKGFAGKSNSTGPAMEANYCSELRFRNCSKELEDHTDGMNSYSTAVAYLSVSRNVLS